MKPNTTEGKGLSEPEKFLLHTLNGGGYCYLNPSKERSDLVRVGLIERWNPLLKATGRNKPYRLTEAGRAALQHEGGGR